MKRILFVACLSMLFCAGCQKDDGGVSSDPADLVGKWKLVKETEKWKEDGQWQTDPDMNYEESADDPYIYYCIYYEDGTFEHGAEPKSTGSVVVFTRGTWSYSDKKIYRTGYYYDDSDDDPDYEHSLDVMKLTSSQLIVRAYFEDGYEEDSYVRIE